MVYDPAPPLKVLTRNSFVVLPFALSLPAGREVASVVVVLQSLVELFGMLVYLRWIPRGLFPENSAGGFEQNDG